MTKHKTTKEVVKEYLISRPLLLRYLAQDLINVSALARRIKNECSLKTSEEAIMMSLYRIAKQKLFTEDEKARQILANTDLAVRTAYAIVVSDQPLALECEATICFGKNYVYILPEREIREGVAGKVKRGLILLEFIHPYEVEHTPGVVFQLLAQFYEMSVNIVELISSRERTYILIDERDGDKLTTYLLEKHFRK